MSDHRSNVLLIGQVCGEGLPGLLQRARQGVDAGKYNSTSRLSAVKGPAPQSSFMYACSNCVWRGRTRSIECLGLILETRPRRHGAGESREERNHRRCTRLNDDDRLVPTECRYQSQIPAAAPVFRAIRGFRPDSIPGLDVHRLHTFVCRACREFLTHSSCNSHWGKAPLLPYLSTESTQSSRFQHKHV